MVLLILILWILSLNLASILEEREFCVYNGKED